MSATLIERATASEAARAIRWPMGSAPTGLHPRIIGRHAECQRIDDFIATVAREHRPLALQGDPGIGKTMLWEHAVACSREANHTVLTSRPSSDDRDTPCQGLHDLLGPAEFRPRRQEATMLGEDLPLVERSRLVLDYLAELSRDAPVMIAIDDVAWLDDVTAHTLRFAMRRLVDRPVTMCWTSRTAAASQSRSPRSAVFDVASDRLDIGAMEAADIRRIIRAAVPAASLPAVTQACDEARGNPFYAIELARLRVRSDESGNTFHTWPGTPTEVLARKVAGLPPDTLQLARLLAVSGPVTLATIRAARASADTPPALRAGLDDGTFTVDDRFVVRFGHPLVAAAVRAQMNALDRQELHAKLAGIVADRDARALHLARATDAVDCEVADEIEGAASRAARRGAPRLAAELLAHAARLTPAADGESLVRRSLAQMTQAAAAGDIPGAISVATDLLDTMEPGPLRAQMIAGRVILDFTDAEKFVREALAQVPARVGESADVACVRGRLLGWLGWLLAMHFGRPQEGLGAALEALAIGRKFGNQDAVLIARATSVVSTASRLLGRREEDLIVEAESLSAPVVHSQLSVWPHVLHARQQLWDGHLPQARESFTAMARSAARNGSEFHRAYRLCDLTMVSLAEGDVDRATEQVQEGMEAASDCADDRALAWLAYPAGVIAAVRGEGQLAQEMAERLDHRADVAHETPRHVMADHVRGASAVAEREWDEAANHLHRALTGLREMDYRHPGAIPVLPLAIHVASLRGDVEALASFVALLSRQSTGLGSPWADEQLRAALGAQQLLADDPGALDTLMQAHQALTGLGYGLDAARVGHFAVTAGLRAGARSRVCALAQVTVATFSRQRAAGWSDLAKDALKRLDGCSDGELTATESQVAGLVAEGRRNKQIAATLFVSESTVEAHLTRIYRKVGVRNRTELAAYQRAHPPTNHLPDPDKG
ncbi:MAG: LuxR C-terminal-related transcriptional regulator [Ornithinimicrobium sp.]